MSKNIVVVESPAKAKTINKYLGSDYTVIASMGHVCDLPPKDGSVRPEDDFAMDWQLNDRSKKNLGEITTALKNADTLVLATDPDREGEAISWHIYRVLNEKGRLKNKTVKRVTFNEITKKAVQDAFDHARDVDSNLVNAYLARRALDYLVGFNLSPVLWRKLPGSKSAGRVQSVALRLVCERENEIEAFDAREYWSVEALCAKNSGENFTARLTHLNGDKLDKFGLPNEETALKAVEAIKSGAFTVGNVEKKQVKRHPSAPFITSTLQQEAARKLGFGASRTMKVAQRLYEGVKLDGETTGLITYMRTDGPTLSGQAIGQARGIIEKEFGKNYLPDSPRQYKSKAKNTQEAHEAIRPTNLHRKPESMRAFLSDEELKLYALIWKRTMASQMESALLDQVAVDITSQDKQTTLRANGSVIAFDGFIKIYREGRDDDDGENDSDEGKILPAVNEGESLSVNDINPEQHFTQPPPRYSEASLVKKLEELGIGRPSTYASILQVLQDRDYVRLEQKRFIPEDRGRVVTAFLQNFFPKYVEYDFTAELEEELDEIAEGKLVWKDLLSDFWGDFSAKIEETKELRIQEVIRVLNQDLEDMLYPLREDGSDRRSCPACKEGRISLKLGKFGGFIGCSNYPECKYTRPLVVSEEEEEQAQQAAKGPRELGIDPNTGKMITVRPGPYGPYVQLEPDEDLAKQAKEEARKATEEATRKAEEKGKKPPKPKKPKLPKPKRASLPKGKTLDTVTLEEAVDLLRLPREVGMHPETGDIIEAGLGRFGPYIKHQNTFASIPKDEDVYTIGMNRAVDLIAQKEEKNKPLKELGNHPEDGKPVTVQNGRWGPFIKHGKENGRLSKEADIDALTLEEAVKILGKSSKGGKKKAAPKKKAASKKKTAPKKK